MSLIDKFSAVEIKADNRISEEDKAFCIRQQEAFDQSGPLLRKIAEAIIEAKHNQQSILGLGEDQYWGSYLVCDGFNCDEDYVYKMMEKRNSRLIAEITNYFSQKYTVKLDQHKIEDHLISVGPEEPRWPWGGYHSMSDDEAATFQEKMSAYKVEKQKFDESLRVLPLRYEQIVDEIFVQLGGFSFQEKAMNEFLQLCWEASHYCNWKANTQREKFEVRNDTLRLTGSWCSYQSWSSYPEFQPSESIKTVLNAAAHYESGKLELGAVYFPDLFRYSTKDSQFSVCLDKVKSIRLFKNGRVDIKFKDAASVQEFVDRYLRNWIGGGDDE